METVKDEEYPEISIRLVSLQKAGRFTELQIAEGSVEISMAGVSRTYTLSSKLRQLEGGKAYLQGQQAIRLSDFGLQAQPRMLGMVKVNDEVSVDFELIIREIDEQD